MPTTKLNNGQLPDTISSKTVDNTNDINTTTTRLKITGGSNGQVLSTDGSGNLSWTTAGGGGGISDGDKGDITVSGSGGTWTIDNDAVTYAKIQNVTTNRLLGRVSAGSGDTEEITIGSGLTVTGTTLSASGGGGGLGAPTAIVTKTADETITDSITLQDDDHLSYAMTNGKYYRFELHLFLTRTNTTANPGFRIAIDANSDGYFGDYGNGTSTAVNLLCNGTTSRTFSFGVNQNIPGYGLFSGRIKATADFTLKLKFAQNTQQAATGSTIMKKSELWIWDLGT